LPASASCSDWARRASTSPSSEPCSSAARVPATILGVAVGGLVIVTSLRTLTASVDVVADNAGVLRTVALVAWAGAIALALVRHRRGAAEGAPDSETNSDDRDGPDEHRDDSAAKVVV
jgi:hypothetical protein